MDQDLIAKRFEIALPFLDEHARRVFLAVEAMAIGHGGISIVSKETGVSRATIASGCLELAGLKTTDSGHTRRKGGGRKKVCDKDPLLRESLRSLMEHSEGDGRGFDLLWTTMSLRTLCGELSQRKQPVSRNLLARLLQEMGWSYHRRRKADGESLPFQDQNARFKEIACTVREFQDSRQPVIYLEMERLEQGEGADAGVPSENALESVEIDGLERSGANEKRCSDIGAGEPCVQDRTLWSDAAMDSQLVLSGVNLVSRWWRLHGYAAFPGARQLLIVTNGVDGWDSSRGTLKEVFEGVDTGLELLLTLCLLPSGMCKWKNVTCRISTFTTWDVPGRPSTIHKVTLSLIGRLPLADRPYVRNWANKDCRHDDGDSLDRVEGSITTFSRWMIDRAL